MRFSQPEKMEIIRLVEESELGVKRTLQELDVPRSSFYRWYRRYAEEATRAWPRSSRRGNSGIAFPIQSGSRLWKRPYRSPR